MKIILFLGGLGNQMFQYAFYKALKNRHTNIKADIDNLGLQTEHNGYELEHIFDIKVNKASSFTKSVYNIQNKKWVYRKIRNLLNLSSTYIEEQQFYTFDSIIFLGSDSGYYSGFWQNEGYFSEISSEIRADFRFKPLTDQLNKSAFERIYHTNSVSVHIRRGDYVDHPSFGGICKLDYYKKAIELMQSKTASAQFFIFSNDIEWCMENLGINTYEFISWNKGTSSYIDMQLMSACKHNIIANSTFSWWGAWLNNNPDKIVIGPKKWLQEDEFDTSTFLPSKWIRL